MRSVRFVTDAMRPFPTRHPASARFAAAFDPGHKSALALAYRAGMKEKSRSEAPGSFRGNKASLPSKPCLACGRPMSWRRSWAKNWAEVKYCSERCRRSPAKAG